MYRCSPGAVLFKYPAWMLARCLPKLCVSDVYGPAGGPRALGADD